MMFPARRVGLIVPTVILVSLVVFLMIRAIPGDPVMLILGEGASKATIEAVRAQLGLDRPLPVQYILWIGQVLKGNLGHSLVTHEAVLPLIWDRFTLTALLILIAVAIASVIAVLAGLFAAWRQNSVWDLSIVILATLGLSLPSFWVGMLLLLVFGIWLGWLPIVGYVGFGEDPARAWQYLVLPVLALVFVEVGVLTRMARASTIEVLRLEYITHARAKGLSERRVLLRHALPNAFGPTWTLIGMVVGTLLGGSAVVETVFTLPGLGRLLVESIAARDYPVIQGCLLFIALTYVLLNLVVDLLYPLFDPRTAER